MGVLVEQALEPRELTAEQPGHSLPQAQPGYPGQHEDHADDLNAQESLPTGSPG
jgi:hypothetical protein